VKLAVFQEQIFFATVRMALGDDDAAVIGTGFLVRVEPRPDEHILFLVSNRHVLADPTARLRVNFHKTEGHVPNAAPALGEVVSLDVRDFSGLYTPHPDPSVDLACLNVSVIAFPENNVFFRALQTGQIATFAEDDLLPGEEVWFVGYPDDRFDVAHNLPILRRGYIASIPTVDYNAKPEFVIDAQMFPGSSGSPAFAVLGTQYRLVGVVTQTMIRNQRLEPVPTELRPQQLGVEQVIGLGIVLKARLVTDLLEHATERVLSAVDAPGQDEPTARPIAEGAAQ
jgi:hypothetical protein